MATPPCSDPPAENMHFHAIFQEIEKWNIENRSFAFDSDKTLKFFEKKKKTKFDHKPTFPWSCDFLVFSIEFAIKNYIESYGQTSKK